MIYVDNVAEALLCGLFKDADRVSGQSFNLGEQDPITWREFYEYFARNLGLDLAPVTTISGNNQPAQSAFKAFVSMPSALSRALRNVVASREFKSLGRRVLITDPVGTLPRKALQRFPTLERAVRKMVKADDAPPIHRWEAPPIGDIVHMGSVGSQLCIHKLNERLGFRPPVARDDALQLTLDWVRHARIV
jgi:nucleoside-diphosphate-sugar epimerase